MSEIFTIHQLGHPLLRRQAEVVNTITEPTFQQQLDALMEFVLLKGGMGIAAPQVGISQQFFILSSHANERYPYAPDVDPFFVINPQIIHHSDSQTKDWEGCLSLPGVRGLVPRYEAITVRYQTRFDKTAQANLDGFLARVFQHEFDHLQGLVFLDRVESSYDVMMEQQWQQHIANQRHT